MLGLQQSALPKKQLTRKALMISRALLSNFSDHNTHMTYFDPETCKCNIYCGVMNKMINYVESFMQINNVGKM